VKLVSKNNSKNRRSSPPVRSSAAYRNGNISRQDIAKSAPGKKSPVKAIIIIISVLAIGCGGLFIGLGFYVDSLDTVFPNVWADGIKVSGLTFDETRQMLINEGYESNAEGISATVVFPDNTSFSVTGEEVGLSYNAEEAAIAAYTFGRDRTFFGNTATYMRSLTNRTDLFDLSSPNFDDSIVRQRATEATRQFNETLVDSNYEPTDSIITITKGTGLHPAIEEDVINFSLLALMRAIDDHEHLSVNYTPEANLDDKIDLQLIFDRIHEEPVSAWFDVDSQSVTNSSAGRTFDLEKAMADLENAEYGATIVIPIQILEPAYSREEVESMLFRDVLAESKTRLANNSSRTSNVRLAAGFINEKVLNPGDVFSFNEVVGRRTSARGFLTAPVIMGGRLQPGIGGGICQVSSTIYDALTRAVLFDSQIEIIERRPHGLTISYLPPGFDATVAYGNIDFRFKNTMDFPMKLETKVEDGEMIAIIWGTNIDGSYIEVEASDPVITTFSIQNIETDELYIGDTDVFTGGQNGSRVEVFQLHFTAEGELISRNSIGTSRYNVQNRVIRHGTAERPIEHLPDTGEQGGEQGGEQVGEHVE